MELRSADCTCNPYMAFSLLLKAGLEGIEKNKKLIAPVDKNMYSSFLEKDIDSLPNNLGESINIMVFNKFIESKKNEWKHYEEKCVQNDEISDWEINNYFIKL